MIGQGLQHFLLTANIKHFPVVDVRPTISAVVRAAAEEKVRIGTIPLFNDCFLEFALERLEILLYYPFTYYFHSVIKESSSPSLKPHC